MSKTLFVRTYSANAFGKNVMLTRKGDVRLEDAHDAKLTELAIKRAYNAGPENKPIQEILKDKFRDMYAKKLRFVNYNKSGEPATEEDKKNLEWNKAYAK